MVVSAGADHQRDQVARLDPEVVDRIDLGGFAEVDFASREPSTFAPTAQLQRPGDAIAAVGVGVDYLGLDSRSPTHGTAPADGHMLSWRRVNGDAMRLYAFRGCELPGPTNWRPRSAWPECPSP